MTARAPVEAVVVGCSAGGLHALHVLLGGMTTDFRPPLVVVCHTGGTRDIGTLCRLLAGSCLLPVAEARERTPADGGSVYVAPAGYHLLIEADRRFALSVDPHVCYVRPAADVLFESAADAYGAGLVGVVLTGANEDGARGLRAVRAHGGRAMVQDPATAEAPTMPGTALALAGADHIVSLEEIALLLNALAA